MKTHNFEINENGVCMNPKLVYHYQVPNALAWEYMQLEIAQFPSKRWGYGIRFAGGGGIPCSDLGADYSGNSQEGAIQAGIKRIHIFFENGCAGMVHEKRFEQYRKHFNEWVLKQKTPQLELF